MCLLFLKLTMVFHYLQDISSNLKIFSIFYKMLCLIQCIKVCQLLILISFVCYFIFCFMFFVFVFVFLKKKQKIKNKKTTQKQRVFFLLLWFARNYSIHLKWHRYSIFFGFFVLFFMFKKSIENTNWKKVAKLRNVLCKNIKIKTKTKKNVFLLF